MSRKLASILIASLWITARIQAVTLSNIIVDQFGWRTGSAKVAILAAPAVGTGSPSAFTPGAGFDIKRVSDNATVFSGAPAQWKAGATDSQSGDKGWWADFSAYTIPGSYYLSLPGGSNPGAQSYPFDLREDIDSDALKATVRSYYYQRCGTAIDAAHGYAWTHASCHPGQATAHLYDGADMGLPRDVRGGWHDAGDYRKYVSFTFSVLWDLMTAYAWNPCAFGDATGIPESGNGVPDILDEVKYELDWLLKMQRPDGALYSGVFVTTNGSNSGSGDPSTENTVYYYANYSSGATSTGAMAFAKAAKLFQSYGAAYPGYAATLQAAAISAWGWLVANPAMIPYNHTNFSNANANIAADDDFRRRVTAAAELFALTGSATYKTYFDANYNNAAGSANGGTYHPILNNEFWPEAADTLEMGLISYALAPGATASVVNAIKAAVKNGADNRVIWDANNQTDLYRGYMWDGYYGWGSNQRKSHWGALAVWATKLGVGTAAEQAAYMKAAEEYLHYIHGRNTLGWVFLTNMGPEGANAGAEQSVNSMYHGWFFQGTQYDGFAGGHIGPAPGILTGGANGNYINDVATSGGTAAYPPAGQPLEKSFRNWGIAWPDCSWTVTENGIYYQAAYTFLVSSFSPCSGPQPTATPSSTNTPYAGTPTFTPTVTPSSTLTGTPVPVCNQLLNGAETIGENGTWSGINALRSIVSVGGVTQGLNCLYVNVTATAGWNSDFANLAGFSPAIWTGFVQLQLDINVAASVVAGATYKELRLIGDCAACGAGIWFQPISSDIPSLVAGQQTVTWNINFGAGTIPPGSPISKITLIYNNNATSPLGAIYIDNVRLIGACTTPTNSPTRTPTRSNTPTPSITATPSPTPSLTATRTLNGSPTLTPSPSATLTLTGTPSASPTKSASPSPSESPSVSPTFTNVPPGSTLTSTTSPTPTSSPTPTASGTLTGTPSSSATQTNSPGPTLTGTAAATLTQTPVCGCTATASVTATLSPTQNNTPDAGGPPVIEVAWALPNPGPSQVAFKLKGPVDYIEARLFTKGYTLIGAVKSAALGAGMGSLALPSEWTLGAASGAYYIQLRAFKSGSASSPATTLKAYFIR